MFCKYKVCFWDQLENRDATECGIVWAGRYTEVMCRIGDYYGEDNINSVSLEFIDNEGTENPIMTERTFKNIVFEED